ncbi:MAG: response regulator [Bacteroidota bacterium]
MNTLKCVIIDDEEIAIQVIENLVDQVPDMKVVAVFYSGVEAFMELDKIDFDVLFLDIQMPKLTGISMLKMMKKSSADGFDNRA